ncbi:uncharacterized protein RJT21DRAFT_118062 [Scheffersomyces amazonensis]|uniref:uncharacterized protein n=1 Tax=Scheffersomyces amazonensis TaxID=1078765 RepID=UPI00315C6883
MTEESVVSTPTIPSTDEKNGPTQASPSSSISSINSDSSTGKLIKKLSSANLVDDANTKLKIPKNNNTDNKKKPVKFTVRKVSHEPIVSPLTSPILQNHPIPNIQKNNNIRVISQTNEDNQAIKDGEKVRVAEYKYEQYQERIQKIEKEIVFLSNLLPPYNVEIDYSTRTKITKAIEKLKMKQDEIEKKKYTLGITISRLRRDHEESDIWIRNFSNQ